MSELDLQRLDTVLRRGEVPGDLLAGLESVDPTTILMVLWAGRLSRRVDAFYQERLRPQGLKYSDYSVLLILRLSGAMSPKQINTYLAITSGGLTKAIQRLEKAKLVSREPDPADGRGTRISLTKEGERTVTHMFQEDMKAHEALFRDIPSGERKRIVASLRHLLDAFER
jgi:DNA-binding MarR family transcriptional regulator